MNIKITKIQISYFKGIKFLEINLNDDVTRISGRNGLGKSTVADAVQWCLFGKNSKGETKFSIKTLDYNGNVIPNVEHSVTLLLSIDGTQRDIKRQWVEKRKQVRGRETDEIEHHSEFYIDGEKFTAKDFDAFIANIVSEGVFRAVTTPTYFLSLKWQEQREFLQRMVGNIDMSSLTANPRYAFLHEGQFKDIAEYLQHLRYNIRQVKEKIDQTPIRIEEINKTMPVERDWNSLQEQIVQMQKKIDEEKHQLFLLKNGSAEDVALKALRDKLAWEQSRIDQMRKSASRMADEAYRQHSEEKQKLQYKLLTAKQNTDALKDKAKSVETIISRLEENLKDVEAKKLRLSAELNSLNEKKNSFKITEEQLACPTCGRPFEDEERTKAIENLKQNFIESYKRASATIVAENKKCNEDIASIKAEIETYRQTAPSYDEIIANGDTIEEIKKQIEALNNPKTAEELLSINSSYAQASAEVEKIQKQIEGYIATDNSELIHELESDIEDITLVYNDVSQAFATKATFENCQARIAQLNEEQETLRSQLDSLQQREDIAIEYQFAENEIIENAVNSHFSLVRFRLFDTLNDGTRKPNCIAMVGGIPYSDLNSATKINAGLDIINAISAYYNVKAPIVIDNAESVNTLLTTEGQQIQLYVTEDENFAIQ